LIPLLDSIAEHMDKTTESIDGKPLLEGILKIREKAAARVATRESTPAKTKSAKPDRRQSQEHLRALDFYGRNQKTAQFRNSS
jgi:cytidylate kinase